MTFKRRRSSIATTAFVAASLIVNGMAADNGTEQQQSPSSLRPTAELNLEQEQPEKDASDRRTMVEEVRDLEDEHDDGMLPGSSAHNQQQLDDSAPAPELHAALDDDLQHLNENWALYQRNLAKSAASTFASFTPQKIARATPLDLKIDTSSGKAYMAGLNGYMQPYSTSSFVIEYGDEKYWDSILDVDNLNLNDVDAHVKRGRIDSESYYEPRASAHGLRGRNIMEATETQDETDNEERRRLKNRLLIEEDRRLMASIAVQLDTIEFKPAGSELDAHDIYWSSHHGVEDGHEGEDSMLPGVEFIYQEGDHDRSLQEVEHQRSSSANVFLQGINQDIDPNQDLDEKTIEARQWGRGRNPNKNNGGGGRYQGNGNGGRNKNKNKNNGNKNKNKNNGSNKKKLPQINNVQPSNGDTIQAKQTFRATVRPSVQTGSAISDVRFQLTDYSGSKSDWLTVPRVGGNGMYEITVDGFNKYPGTQWGFEIVAQDQRGKKKSSGANVFKVGGVGGSGSNFANNGGGGNNGGNFNRPQQAPPAPSPPSQPRPMAMNKVTDSDWNAGGAIQGSTGRILFEFDNSGQTFVCSGIVLCDGPRGQTPNKSNGRAVIQTAAHCAYSDIMKKFATKAIFIPDQDSTRGDKSDFDCSNDRYGCWHLSFAVVAEGWTSGSFPTNVDWDYAYYTVIDSPHTHSGGYKPGLTGKLDHDVACVKVDFDTDISKKFVFSIGYSADKDPHLRHCAMENTAINGVPWYTNYWLDDCAMTGGASGGGWIMDMDEDGHGTLISVNSWGFTHKAGMAGPKLSTKSGSWAECLFEKAQRGNDPGNRGGYIIDKC